MAEYLKAYQRILTNEGGYVNDPQDKGGETYKGIARAFNSKWEGWVQIDMAKKLSNFPLALEQDSTLQQQIREFYEVNYWDRIKGDLINNQVIAESIFDFAVNAGVGTASRLAQKVIEVKPDGVIGTVTIDALNAFDTELFLASFALAKIARYVSIVQHNRTNAKFFYGWVCRSLGEV